MTIPTGDDRLVDGQRIADVLRQDEDDKIDAYLRQAFPGHLPADADRDTQAGAHSSDSGDVLEAKTIAGYVRSYFPGATP
jgi:hypothetical protein